MQDVSAIVKWRPQAEREVDRHHRIPELRRVDQRPGADQDSARQATVGSAASASQSKGAPVAVVLQGAPPHSAASVMSVGLLGSSLASYRAPRAVPVVRTIAVGSTFTASSAVHGRQSGP